jgi:hypothetical protein
VVTAAVAFGRCAGHFPATGELSCHHFSQSLQEFSMEVIGLLFDSKYGVAAFATVTLAIALLTGGLGLLAHKSKQR